MLYAVKVLPKKLSLPAIYLGRDGDTIVDVTSLQQAAICDSLEQAVALRDTVQLAHAIPQDYVKLVIMGVTQTWMYTETGVAG